MLGEGLPGLAKVHRNSCQRAKEGTCSATSPMNITSRRPNLVKTQWSRALRSDFLQKKTVFYCRLHCRHESKHTEGLCKHLSHIELVQNYEHA